MRGIISWGTSVPHWRLDRGTIAAVAGQGGGRGTRTVASFDQDAVTLATEAARSALAGGVIPDALLFGTVSTPVTDHTNASVIHAALGLPSAVAAMDLGASVRSVVGGLMLATRTTDTVAVNSSPSWLPAPSSLICADSLSATAVRSAI